MASVKWMQRFKHTDVAAYASCVLDRQTAQAHSRFGVSFDYRF
jgi:hypothetical protein